MRTTDATFSGPIVCPRIGDSQNDEHKEPLADTLSLLTQTAEAALARTDMLGELSRLLLQVKQSADGVRDAWFVIDLRGNCVYLNPAAETLCDIRLEQITATYGSHLSGAIKRAYNNRVCICKAASSYT